MSKYIPVIGLEVHCELKSNSKNFSSAKNGTGEVNTNLSVVDIGYPGILPVVNKEAVKKSIMVALALNCRVPEKLVFDRKNYYYPDLPKGYQITQFGNPIGTNGYVMINVDGVEKKITIRDTHLEEDTANMDHLSTYSLIDYNRAGVPLLETVTDPCINSAKEAVSSAINKIKGLMNFKWSIPKPSLPSFHASLKWSQQTVFGKTFRYPSGISWNKLGGIFTQPTIFATPNAGLQGVGEAGAEAILPLNGFYKHLDDKLDRVVGQSAIDYDMMTNCFVTALESLTVSMSAKEVGRLTSKYTEQDITARTKRLNRLGGVTDIE